MRSAMRSATSRMWVVMITVQPARTRSCSSPLTWRADSASRPVSGSSRMIRRGIVHQRAGQRHLLAHALGKAFAAFVQMRLEAERGEQRVRRSFGGRGVDAPEAGDEFEIFQRRQLVINHRLVGHPRHHLLGGDGIGQRIDAEHRHRAGVGPQQAGDHAQGGGLAGAVGAEQRVKFADADGEIERIDRQAGQNAWLTLALPARPYG